MFDIVDATLLLALFTFILALATVNSTRKLQEDQKINRELNWIEKQVENFYNPLIFVLGERKGLIEKLEKTYEKEDILKLNKLLENSDKINEIYSKYLYVGLSWENYFTNTDISDFIESNLLDKNEIDKYRNILINKHNELGKEHAILRGKIKTRGVSVSELKKIFK
ncbi:MAG: hypothetical protein Q8O41_08360 [Candidatus Methanoperedens sp.]|nr:hypothetical protein [Candidatus Methanoperedens sp.]